MARNLIRSYRGFRWSLASWSTRSLKDNQLISRLIIGYLFILNYSNITTSIMISGLKQKYLRYTNFNESILFQEESKKNRGFRNRKEGSEITFGGKASRTETPIQSC